MFFACILWWSINQSSYAYRFCRLALSPLVVIFLHLEICKLQVIADLSRSSSLLHPFVKSVLLGRLYALLFSFASNFSSLAASRNSPHFISSYFRDVAWVLHLPFAIFLLCICFLHRLMFLSMLDNWHPFCGSLRSNYPLWYKGLRHLLMV